MKRMKILPLLTWMLLVLFLFPAAVQATNLQEPPRCNRLIDEASLLTQDEFNELLNNLDETSLRHEFDIVIWILPTADGISLERYAQDAFDQNGFGQGDDRNGLLLLLSMQERTYHVHTSGTGRNAFPSHDIEDMMQDVLPVLGQGEYYEALTSFVKAVDLRLEIGLTIPNGRLNPRLVDRASLLTPDEYQKLLALLDEISERQRMDVVIWTVESLGALTPMEYADDTYDYNGYGFGPGKDGILLLLSMEERDYWVTTTGYGITVFTDYGIKYHLMDSVLPYLGRDDWYGGFTQFANKADEMITTAKTDRPVDINYPDSGGGDGGGGRYRYTPSTTLFAISLIIGAVAALITCLVMRSRLRTMRKKTEAADYCVGGLQLQGSYDHFLYKNVSRILIERDSGSRGGGGGSSTHTSSSGSSHGGGGGKF